LHLGSAPSQVALSGDTSAPAVHDSLATELEVPSTSDIAGPSQPIPSGSSTSATELVDDTFTAGHDASQLASTSSSAAGPVHPTFDSSASISTGESAMVDGTLATGHEGSELVSTLSDPSQPTSDSNAGASLGEFTTVHDILTAGDEGLRFLSTRLDPEDPSQPVSGFGTSANEITTVDNTRVPGYEASQSSVTFSGPSQFTFDLNASVPVGELPTVEETLAAGHESMESLSTLSGPGDPSQPSLDFGAGTSHNGSTTVDDTWAKACEVSQASYASLGPSQPTFNLNAGAAFVGEFSTVGETLAAGHELMEFLSTLSGPGDPSQPILDFGAGTSNNGSTTVDNTWVPGYEASQSSVTFSGPSQPTFDLNAGTAFVGEFSAVGETLAAGHELMEFLSTCQDPEIPLSLASALVPVPSIMDLLQLTMHGLRHAKCHRLCTLR